MNMGQRLTATAMPPAFYPILKSALFADGREENWIATKYTAAHCEPRAKIWAAGAFYAMSRVI